MSRTHLRSALIATAILSTSQIGHSAPTFFDGFESRNTSAPASPPPAINTSGFRWRDMHYSYIGGVVNGTSSSIYSAAGAINDRWTDHDLACKSGTYCLQFRFNAGGDMAEQRFDLGRSYPELWLSYWIRVPFNFTHGSMNNKWLALWTSVYDGPGTITWQTRPNGNGGANLVVQDGGVQQTEDLRTPFIRVPEDRGRWMQIVVRAKASSAAAANDGIIQLFRRWEGETSFAKIHEKLNARFYQGGAGIKAGYLMGWANDPYRELTFWLVDDFTVSESSLLSSASNPPEDKTPNAPTLSVQ